MILAQFRSRYPQGSLISELLTIHNGKYLVRAVIQIDGITLATGLAAADTPEQAEDRARERALAILNLDGQSAIIVENGQTPIASSEIPPSPPPSLAFDVPPISSPPKATTNTVSAPKPPKTPKSSAKVTTNAPSAPKPTAIEPPSFDEPLLLELAAESVEDSLPPDLDEPILEPLAEEAPSEPYFSEPLAEEVPPEPYFSEPLAEEVPSEPYFSEPLAEEVPSEPYVLEPSDSESLDFSEVIARSNVEMKRLKWTQEEGRNYLLQTYGKRSRQLLSDEELLEFLHYLKGLPTP